MNGLPENNKNTAKLKLPKKQTMNLCAREKSDNSLSKVLPVFLLLVIFVAVFAKFGVIDRFAALSETRSRYEAAQTQLAELNSSLSDYDQVQEDYYRYTKHYLTADELALMDRVELLDLLETKSRNLAYITSVSITGNAAVIKVRADTLADVATLRLSLEKADGVTGVTVYNADTTEATEENAQYVTASLLVDVAKEDGADE